MDTHLTPFVGTSTPNTASGKDEISKTAEEFEAVFLGLVVNEMMKGTMPETMNGGHGEEMMRSLLGNEIGSEIAKSGGIGVAKSIEAKLRAYK